LKCWYKILKKGGKLQIIIPDMLFHIEQFLDEDPFKKSVANPDWTNLQHSLAGFWGWQNDGETEIWDIHKSGYDFRLLKMKLEEFGFNNIKRLEDKPWNLNVICQKQPEIIDSHK